MRVIGCCLYVWSGYEICWYPSVIASWFIELFAKDLEAFSAHAKRTTVTPQDVRLVARRQPNIVSKLDEIVSILEEEKRKKRKKNDATFNVCLTKKEMKNFDNSFNFNWNTQRKWCNTNSRTGLPLRSTIPIWQQDICLPFSLKTSTNRSEAPFTTAGIRSKSGVQFTNPVI